MDDLFASQRKEQVESAAPLADRLRPQSFDQFYGQEHIAGEGTLLRRMIDADRLTSMIFYGPPGTGKTTLALLIANKSNAHLEKLHASSAGTADVRKVTNLARERLSLSGEKTILFIDELHRFSKNQQDSLLDDVEKGMIILIGATTENPFFSINSPLISRCQLFEFKPLDKSHLEKLISHACESCRDLFNLKKISISDDAIEFYNSHSDGDARRVLLALELGVLSELNPGKSDSIHIDEKLAEQTMQRKTLVFQRTGDQHYDAASALIKSMRGSDPDASLYWLAYLLEAGEDINFIARRIVIAASEDVGNADPQALLVATAAAEAVRFVGLPEAQLSLAQAVTYLACAPKSNASTMGIARAKKDVKSERTLTVPRHLINKGYKNTPSEKEVKYLNPHDYESGWVDQEYLGESKHYYHPVNRGYESVIKKYLDTIRKNRNKDS